MINPCNASFTLFISGVLYKDECPLEPMIPIFLVVGGISACATVLIGIMFCLTLDYESLLAKAMNILSGALCAILSLFCFAWYIAGCVWIYKSYHTVTGWESDVMLKTLGYRPCNKTLFYFAFSMLQLAYILFAACVKICK